jgi:hypothetical protein
VDRADRPQQLLHSERNLLEPSRGWWLLENYCERDFAAAISAVTAEAEIELGATALLGVKLGGGDGGGGMGARTTLQMLVQARQQEERAGR